MTSLASKPYFSGGRGVLWSMAGMSNMQILILSGHCRGMSDKNSLVSNLYI